MDACLNGWINGIYLDNVMIWKCFLRYWPFVMENHRSVMDFPHKGPGTGAVLLAFCEGKPSVTERFPSRTVRNAGIDIWTHWGWVTHICISKLMTIGSDNGLSPSRCHAIIWSTIVILAIGPLETKNHWNLNRNQYIFIQDYAFENIVCNMASILSLPQC